ncbi:hypothetical protein EV182_002266 [Spiromyces aspiralis]|uniref:Uncharacterized protein n=1 Tax=Spiromyces aspiralis TaxID=68401 RepID=A0ACC1HS05_9FUNG|nr:hypothetical protein EV182_002266 [Spiromyces aspiralis]
MENDWAHLEDTKTLLNVGRTGVYLSALEGDIRSLLREYQKLQVYDFESFGTIWKSMNFSLIHFVATEKHARENLMHCLYRVILGHFRQSAMLEIKLGVVYGLYLLYYTQPASFPNVRVRMTMNMWKKWSDLYVHCKDSNIKDAVYCIDKMRDDSIFDYVAWVDDHEGLIALEDGDNIQSKATSMLAQIEQEVMASSQGGIADPITNKRRISLVEDYIKLKRRLLSSRLTNKAARSFYNQAFRTGGEGEGEGQSPGNEDQPLPAPIPLDTTHREIAWWDQVTERVRNYQRNRSERVGTGANEDDGSLRMLADFSAATSQQFAMAASLDAQQQGGQVDYDQNRTFISAPLRATLRSLQRQQQQQPSPSQGYHQV